MYIHVHTCTHIKHSVCRSNLNRKIGKSSTSVRKRCPSAAERSKTLRMHLCRFCLRFWTTFSSKMSPKWVEMESKINKKGSPKTHPQKDSRSWYLHLQKPYKTMAGVTKTQCRHFLRAFPFAVQKNVKNALKIEHKFFLKGIPKLLRKNICKNTPKDHHNLPK